MIDDLAPLTFLACKLSRNQLSHTIPPADLGLSSRVGLKYFLEIHVKDPDTGIYEFLHTGEGREKPPYMQSGIEVHEGAKFTYNSGRGGKLDGLLVYEKPSFRQSALGLGTRQTLSYYFSERITGGTPAIDVTNFLHDVVHYVAKAGLNNEDFYAHGETFFSLYQAANRRFLTWQPNYKPIGPDQEEYLAFLNNYTPLPSQINLRCQATFADGSVSPPTTISSIQGISAFSIVNCPVGPAVISPKFPGKTVVSFEVWISDQDNKRISEIRTYLVDRNYVEKDRTVLFVNSLGGWDTIRFTGEAEKTLSTTQNTAILDRPDVADIEFSELKIISVEGQEEITMSTGYFPRNVLDTMKYLDELLLSEEMYLVTEKGHRPLQVLTSSTVNEADNVDLVARKFQFRILTTIENYSDLPLAAPVSARATKWVGIAEKILTDAAGFRTGYRQYTRLALFYVDTNTMVLPMRTVYNVQSHPSYIAPIRDLSITPGSTPFPSEERTGPSLVRNNCPEGHIGRPGTIVIAAGKYGGETQAESNALADAELLEKRNDQGLANTLGSCELARIAINVTHKIRMNGNFVVGTSNYGPKIRVRTATPFNSAEYYTPQLTGGISADITHSYYMAAKTDGTPTQIDIYHNSEFAGEPYQQYKVTCQFLSNGNNFLHQSIYTDPQAVYANLNSVGMYPGEILNIIIEKHDPA